MMYMQYNPKKHGKHKLYETRTVREDGALLMTIVESDASHKYASKTPWFYIVDVEEPVVVTLKGGPGSGHRGHAGRPGKRGGSLAGSVAMSVRTGKAAAARAGWKPNGPGAFKTITEAEKWLGERGVHVVTGLDKRPSLEDLNAVAKEIDKLPQQVIDDIAAVGSSMDLVVDSGITVHPDAGHLRGVTPRGWPPGTSWDAVPGAGATWPGGKTIIVANHLRKSGSINLILHEHGHTYSAAHFKLSGVRVSDSSEWSKVHKNAWWPTAYTRKYSTEAFAESFAAYFTGGRIRSDLDESVVAFFDERFG